MPQFQHFLSQIRDGVVGIFQLFRELFQNLISLVDAVYRDDAVLVVGRRFFGLWGGRGLEKRISWRSKKQTK